MTSYAPPYSDQQIAAALAALELNGGNITLTAEQQKISRITLRTWRDAALAVSTDLPLKRPDRDYCALWADAQEIVLDAAVAMAKRLTAPTAENLNALSRLAGIASDKYLDHRDGRRGAVQIGSGADKVQVNFNL